MIKESNGKLIVTAPILEVYIPLDYAEKNLYFMKGELIEFYGVCNMKAFKSEAELSKRDSVKTIPVGIPMMITTNPTDTDVIELKLYPDVSFDKFIVLRYYKDDELMCNQNCIKSTANVTAVMNMLENGKLTFIPSSTIKSLIKDAQSMNGVNLRMGDESLDAMISERFRDPDHPSRKLRFSANRGTNRSVSVTPREETMLSTTYQAFAFEDINSSLIASVNRAKSGKVDETTIMEKIIRGGTVESPT